MSNDVIVFLLYATICPPYTTAPVAAVNAAKGHSKASVACIRPRIGTSTDGIVAHKRLSSRNPHGHIVLILIRNCSNCNPA